MRRRSQPIAQSRNSKAYQIQDLIAESISILLEPQSKGKEDFNTNTTT